MMKTEDNDQEFDFSAMFNRLRTLANKEYCRCEGTLRYTDKEETCPQCGYLTVPPKSRTSTGLGTTSVWSGASAPSGPTTNPSRKPETRSLSTG